MANDQNSRISLIDDESQLPEEDRHHFEAIERSRGSVRGPFRALLNSPEVAGRAGHLGEYIRYESTLSGPERELAILTTGREFECAYEWSSHEPIAQEVGVRDEAISAVAEQEALDHLTDTEACIVSFGRELFREKEVTDATFESAHNQFGVQGVTELVATMGYYSLIASVLNAFVIVPDQTDFEFRTNDQD